MGKYFFYARWYLLLMVLYGVYKVHVITTPATSCVHVDKRLSTNIASSIRKNISSLNSLRDACEYVQTLYPCVKNIDVRKIGDYQFLCVNASQPVAKINSNQLLLENGAIVPCEHYQHEMTNSLITVLGQLDCLMADGTIVVDWITRHIEQNHTVEKVYWFAKNMIVLESKDMPSSIITSADQAIDDTLKKHIMHVEKMHAQSNPKTKNAIVADVRFNNMIICKSGGDYHGTISNNAHCGN
jgi:hypothetical protein